MNHIYDFDIFKQDLDKKICICAYNFHINEAFFSFQYTSINEYIITKVKIIKNL